MNRPLTAIAACLGLCLAIGCATPRYVPKPAAAVGAELPTIAACPRELPMFAGRGGQPMHWSGLQDAVAWADIVILGEQHDDAMAHQVQLALVDDVFNRWPDSALSMEMLERDEQMLVDDYLDDIIDANRFVRQTFSENWGGEGSWGKWYQPMLDIVKRRGGRAIAANAPRRYVRMARLRGYGALAALPPQRRALFDIPPELPRNIYFDRFSDVMSHIDDPDALDAIFRSQMVWDATMARSIVRARPRRDAKVIHLVGRFHSDFEGGLVQEIRRHKPWARILVFSMEPTDSRQLREGDVGRADVMIYTGEQEDANESGEADTDAESTHPVETSH